jgi:hypothetical protein
VKKSVTGLRRAVLPLAVFFGVALFHFVWVDLFPEQNPAQTRWVTIAQPTPPLERYLETQSYLLGYSYALAFSFAAVALRGYRERRSCMARGLAIGGVTFSGFLAVAGCYLIGCCGSPMLGVYLSLFGAAFLPLAKPLVAIFTTVSVVLSWWWMSSRRRSQRSASFLKAPG